jgi:nucleotide-binding universal stress UspA family protein
MLTMNQFDSILVPLDGSRHDNVAIPAALDQALRHNARLVLVFIVERPEPVWIDCGHGGPSPILTIHEDHDLAGETEAAGVYLDKLRHRFHLFANVDTVIRSGDPVRQIEYEAEARKRPLTVMAIEPADRDMRHAQPTRASRLTQRGRLQLMLVAPLREGRKPTRREGSTTWRDLATAGYR